MNEVLMQLSNYFKILPCIHFKHVNEQGMKSTVQQIDNQSDQEAWYYDRLCEK